MTSEGATPIYQLSFLMVDHLIERRGFARVVESLQAFSTNGEGDQHFERVFGLTLGAFEREVVDGLATPRR